MAEFKIVIPKLGESIQEATITKWFVKEGDKVAEDDLLMELATDKVDSEIPSPVEGSISKIFFPEGTLLPVGEVVALISLSDDEAVPEVPFAAPGEELPLKAVEIQASPGNGRILSNRFYSPLVRKIAREELVSSTELENIEGSGTGGRVQKKDILKYLESRQATPEKAATPPVKAEPVPSEEMVKSKASMSFGAEDQIIEMDRIRKLIAEHMIRSQEVSAHVTTVVEADVTTLVQWRSKVKDDFQAKYGEKLTYMPFFMEAVVRALTEYPWLNASIDGEKIILHKNINLGIAVAKPDGNLIVPVVKNAGEKNLVGLVKSLNVLADSARRNKLSPDDIREGTFSITNFGTFRNLIGTPIINQPQVAILATGSIEKKPAVLELPSGDVIAIRHKMFLSLSYDHRIVDGSLGGAFLRRIADLLEEFDINRPI